MTKTIYSIVLLIVANDVLRRLIDVERFSNYMSLFLVSALIGVIVNVILFKLTDKGDAK